MRLFVPVILFKHSERGRDSYCVLSDEINLRGDQEKNYVLIFELCCLDRRNNLFLERQIQRVIASVVPCDVVIVFFINSAVCFGNRLE